MATYKIIRFFKDRESRTIKTGLTLEEVREHCRNLETSSSTCKEKENVEHTMKYGEWFDGYATEK